MYRKASFAAFCALLLALGAFWLAARPSTLTVRGHIMDDTTAAPVVATVSVDGRVVATAVTAFEVDMPADDQTHVVEVIAPGYHRWAVGLRSRGEHQLEGPIRLRRLDNEDKSG